MTTIELPDALADRLRAAAEAEGKDLNHYAVAKLERYLDETESDSDTDEDLIDSLRQGIADDEAGRVLTLEELDTHVYGLLSGKADNKTNKGVAA